MNAPIEPLFTRRVRGPISSSPLLADVDRDGAPEAFVGGPVLSAFRWDGEPIERWPKRARKPFASSPALGDVNGDGRAEIVVGCDDGRVRAFFADGDPLPGWPVSTGRDVFSTPALADLDGDKALEVVVGSDDGCVYAISGQGRVLWRVEVPGRPFTSASPTIGDMDGDGRPEVSIGAWDGKLRTFDAAGRTRDTRFPAAGYAVWSSATAFRVQGIGPCLAWAADRAYVAAGAGLERAGWTRRTGSWMVSSPAVVELRKGEGGTVIVGSERLYAWDLAGRVRTGWPVDAGDFLWSSPIAFDLDGDGRREVLVGSWDGGLYAFRPDGTRVEGFPLRTRGPMFATPAAAPLPGGGGLLVAASWDGTVRGWRLPRARFQPGDWLQFRGDAARTGWQSAPFPHLPPAAESVVAPSESPRVEGASVERWSFGRGLRRIVIQGPALHRAERLSVSYRVSGESGIHPVPAVNSGGRFVALVQPLRLPHRIEWWVELVADHGRIERWPHGGSESFITFPSLLDDLVSHGPRGGSPRRSSSAGPRGLA